MMNLLELKFLQTPLRILLRAILLLPFILGRNNQVIEVYVDSKLLPGTVVLSAHSNLAHYILSAHNDLANHGGLSAKSAKSAKSASGPNVMASIASNSPVSVPAHYLSANSLSANALHDLPAKFLS